MTEVRPSNDRLLSALMGDVELEEHEKITTDEAKALIHSMGSWGLSVDEAVEGIESICIAAHGAGIPQLIEAELQARAEEERLAFWRSIVSLAAGSVVFLGLFFLTLWAVMG